MTTGAPASTMETVQRVPPAVMVSEAEPVGSSWPVVLPAGSWKPSPTRYPANGTPGIWACGTIGRAPDGVDTRWMMIWPVLVLRVTIRVTSPVGTTQPFSMAYRPTTAEQLPQLLPQSTAASSMPTWAKVNSTSTSASAGR